MVLDDHIAVGEGTRAILQAEFKCHVKVFVEPFSALLSVEKEKYDVYLIDFNLPTMNGLQFIEHLLQIHLDAVIIIYTGHQIDKYLVELWHKGVMGLISKTDSRKQLIDTILYALEGKLIIEQSLLTHLLNHRDLNVQPPAGLTKREMEILNFVKGGLTNKAIALELHLSQRSIEKSLTTIFSKLAVESRAEAVIKWNELTMT